MKYNYIIFHKGCIDGFASFIILYKSQQINKNAKIYPDTPSTKTIPEDIYNKDVIIMDVAYNYDILKEIIKRAKSVLYIDHHITNYNEINTINDEKFKMIYDVNECGASLTWKYLFPKMKIPYFIKMIKDNDIGIWKMNHTHDFISGLSVKYGKEVSHDNIDKWLKLFNDKEVNNIIKKGIIYNEYVEYIINASYNKFSQTYFPSTKVFNMFPNKFKKIKQYKVAFYTGRGCPNNTLLSLKILDKTSADFVLFWTYNIERNEYIVSLRSKKINVGYIAKLFGGGGHDLAASFNLSKNILQIEDLVQL